VYQSAILYLDDRAWGITFAFVNLAFRSFFIGISSSSIISWSTFATAAANVVLNYGLIFGNFNLPAMGISGAAIASSLAEIVGTIVFFSYAFVGKFHQSFQLFAQWKWKKDVMAHITKIASPVMFQ
jgi:Na+-driven multidrug efflux pump